MSDKPAYVIENRPLVGTLEKLDVQQVIDQTSERWANQTLCQVDDACTGVQPPSSAAGPAARSGTERASAARPPGARQPACRPARTSRSRPPCAARGACGDAATRSGGSTGGDPVAPGSVRSEAAASG